MSPGFVSTDQIYNIIILVSHPLYSVRDFYIERIFEIWISLELTLTLLDFFITNVTRTGFKLIEFNSYKIELGLELMKMLKFAPNTRQRKDRLRSRPWLFMTLISTNLLTYAPFITNFRISFKTETPLNIFVRRAFQKKTYKILNICPICR